NVGKVEPINEGEDLTHAKAQKAAMDRAKVKLADAATKAKGQAKAEATEVIVVSVVPELKDDRPEATIVLLQGKRFSTASERLDSKSRPLTGGYDEDCPNVDWLAAGRQRGDDRPRH